MVWLVKWVQIGMPSLLGRAFILLHSNTSRMRQAVLNIDHDTLAEFGFAVFQDARLLDIEILSCEGPRGVSRLNVEEQPDEQRLDDLEMVQWWEHVSDEGGTSVYLVEMDITDQLDSVGVDADEVPRVEQAAVHERGVSVDQAGPQEQLSEMLADLRAAGFNISLVKLQDYRIEATPLDALTDRQREVLEVAYDSGYYDVPRSASTAEIAAELGVDDSTVAEHLQRAERNLLASLLD